MEILFQDSIPRGKSRKLISSRAQSTRGGGPNPRRSSRPVLTVPLLLRTHRQEEGDGASEREDGTSGVWALQGSFFALG